VLRLRGVDALLLACTELPIAFAQAGCGMQLVDPTQALAQACVDISLGASDEEPLQRAAAAAPGAYAPWQASADSWAALPLPLAGGLG